MPAVAKLCIVCGEDVAGKKRMKDPHGQYYCEPCYNAKLAKAKAGKSHKTAHAAVAPPPHPASAAVETLEPPPADDGLLDLLPDQKHDADEEMFGCSGCKKIVPKRQIRNIDGEFLCTACNAARTRAQGASRAAATAAADDAPAARGFGDSLIGGTLFTFASLALVFGIVFGLQLVMALPMPADVEGGWTLKDTSTAIGVAITYSFWNFGFALVTWIAVIIAIKTGRGNGATFGATLWKTFSVCGIITIFFRFTDQLFLGYIFGILPLLLFIARSVILDVGLAMMFDFEGTPRKLVAGIGILFSELMGFLFYVLFGVLLATSVIHTNGKGLGLDDDEQDTKAMQQFQEEMRQKMRQQGLEPPAPGANKPAANANKPADGNEDNFPYPLPQP